MGNDKAADRKGADANQMYEPALSHKQASQANSLLGIRKANAEPWQLLLPVTPGNIVGGIAILMLHPDRIRQFIALTRGKES